MNIYGLNLYEFMQLLLVVWFAFAGFVGFTYWRRTRRLKIKKISPKQQRRTEKWSAINGMINFTTILVLTSLLLFQSEYFSNRIVAYMAVSDNCEKMMDLKNEQTQRISNDCMNVIESAEGKVENLNSIVDDIRKNYNDLVQNYDDCQIQNFKMQETLGRMPFLKVAENFPSQHEYDKYFYNCVDFSNKAVDILRNLGYDAYTESVKVDCSSGLFGCKEGDNNHHMIVIAEIPFEATGVFTPIPPWEFDAYGLK